ncbi:MAG: hypothetical protein R3F61_38770 [Myxococcota bacterium]
MRSVERTRDEVFGGTSEDDVEAADADAVLTTTVLSADADAVLADILVSGDADIGPIGVVQRGRRRRARSWPHRRRIRPGRTVLDAGRSGLQDRKRRAKPGVRSALARGAFREESADQVR